MKKKVKIIGLALVVVGLIVYAIYASLQPLQVETRTLELSTSEITFTELGFVTNSATQVIYPLAPGKVKEVLVKKGDSVKKGDILAKLDHTSLDFQLIQLEKTIDGYTAQLASAEVENLSTIDSLKSNRNNLYGQLKALKAEVKSDSQKEIETLLINQSKSVLDRGTEDLAKYEELFNSGYISESEYKDFQSLVKSYDTAYNQTVLASASSDDYYEGMSNSIYAQIQSINLTLEKDMLTSTQAYYTSLIDATRASIDSLKSQIQDYDITAPTTGNIEDVMIENVNLVNGLEPAFIIQGEGQLEVEVKVNTRDIDIIQVGDDIRLTLDRRAGDVTLNGKIKSISNSATMEISALGIEERKVLVTIMPEKSDSLKTGYDIDVTFIVFSDSDNIIIPNSALYKKDMEDFVLVIKDSKVLEVPVSLGYELTGETIILQGLSEGDQLVTDLEAKGLSVGKKAVSSNE